MTAQIPDRLEMDGEEWHLLATPLEEHLAKTGRSGLFRPGPSTALWRGYVASWKLNGEELFLTGIEEGRFLPPDGAVAGAYVHGRGASIPSLEDLFPGSSDLGVPAVWVSGTLRAAKGRVLHYVHAGFASVFEHEVRIRVRQGRVESRRHLSGVVRLSRRAAAKLLGGFALAASPWVEGSPIEQTGIVPLLLLLGGSGLFFSGGSDLVELIRRRIDDAAT